MSFKRKFITAATSTLAVVAFSTFVSAQDTTTQPNDSTQKQEMRHKRGDRDFGGRGMRGGKHGGAGKMLLRGLGPLNLSDAQKEQVRTITENFRTATQPQHEEMRQLGMKKRDGIITADEQARLKDLKTQLKATSEQTHAAVLAVLNAEQRAQLDQVKERMKQRKTERHQNRQKETAPPTQDN